MAVQAQKIRLGAASSQTITIGAVGTELGATQGGAELNYNPSILEISIDQALMAIASYKTKEDIDYACTLAEFQLNRLSLAWSYGQNLVVTVSGTPSTDTLYFGNYGNVPFGMLDSVIPKQDGTTNNLLLHLHKVYSSKAIKIHFQRDKNTTLDKLTLSALADVSQPAGQQGGWIREQY